MVVKEELSLFPSSVKSLPGVREGNVPIKRSFHWLLIATLALMFGWLVLLSVRSYQPALSEEMVSSLMRGQEVFQILIEPNPTRIFFKSQQPNWTTQARDRRESVSSQTSTIEGDIIVRDQTPGKVDQRPEKEIVILLFSGNFEMRERTLSFSRGLICYFAKGEKQTPYINFWTELYWAGGICPRFVCLS